MKNEEFWNSVEATEEEKKKGAYYLRERGLEEHFNVLYYLQSFVNNAKRKIKYEEIATVLRYDKRIRRFLFKYLGVVEERLRAHFLNYFREKVSLINPTNKYKEMMNKYNNDLYKSITHLTLGYFVVLFTKQENALKLSVFKNVENLNMNLTALVILRNQVYHNKFLLNNLELGKCKYKGSIQASLNANIKNLYFLSDVSKKIFNKEIKACADLHYPKYKNQVNWNLLSDVVLVINVD